MAKVGNVTLLFEAKALIGEGPFYDKDKNELLWVDIEGKTIDFLDLETTTHRSLQLSDRVGAVIPCENDDSKLIAVIGRKICFVNRITGDVEQLCSVEEEKQLNRFNDCKCDRQGRLWCGTMSLDPVTSTEPNQGSLYSYDAEKVKKHLSNISISNGIVWNLDWTKMYYIDSLARKVYSFDYNETDGSISNQKVAVDYAQDDSLGFPDGMTIDCEGKLWVCGFFGSAVTRWDPTTGKKLASIPIPAKKVTSCCFGGVDYSTMFVTTACHGSDEQELREFPHSGALFTVENLGVRGLPAHKFKAGKK